MNNARLDTAHKVSNLLKQEVFYPPHSPRTESPAYAKVHKRLTKQLDLPCIVCGVRNSTLSDPTANWAQAKAIETHHHVVEWALQNAIDVAKFNARIVAFHRAKPHHDPMYDTDFTQQQMLDWIDHHPDNLWVICDVHHRHSEVGIHSVTYPVWGAQDLIADGFQYTPTEKIGGPNK